MPISNINTFFLFFQVRDFRGVDIIAGEATLSKFASFLKNSKKERIFSPGPERGHKTVSFNT